jgi:hypothetical protein
MTFEKIAERSAIPFARGQEERIFGWGGVAFGCHVTSLAQRRAKTFSSSVCAIGGSGKVSPAVLGTTRAAAAPP